MAHRQTNHSHGRVTTARGARHDDEDNGATGKARRGRHREEDAGPETSPAAASDEAGEDRMHRAEEMVDRFAARVGEVTAQVGHHLLRWGARAREEAEDIWAEAQDLHRRRRGKA